MATPSALERLIPSARPHSAPVLSTAIYGGALVLGTVASILDLARVPLHGELLATFGLAIVYAALIGLAVRITHDRQQRLPALADFLALSPSQFELAVGELLAGSGYNGVRHVGGTGDLAADLLCRDARGRLVAVQCKRYTPGMRIGSATVQAFIGMVVVHHRANHGIIVTTAEFTRPAQELAQEHGVILIDGRELVTLAARVVRDPQTIEPYTPNPDTEEFLLA